MNKLINKLFGKDSVIKVISVLIAILIWFLVQDQDNPFTERTISVPLTSNVDVLDAKNLQIVGSSLPAAVDIKIKGRKQRLDSVTPNDFRVSLDLSGVMGSGNQDVKIGTPEYTGNKDIIISGMNPSVVKLRFEKIVGKQYSVNINFTGKLPEGYEIVNKKIDPENVLIQEKESTIAKVNEVVAVVNLSDLSKTKEKVIRAVVYDTSGKPMSQFDGKYPVLVSFDLAKKLPVSAAASGNPKDGYYFREIVPETSDVAVIGSKNLLDSLSAINSGAVNIDGKSESFRTELSLLLPKGASLLEPDSPVMANVLIDPLAIKTVSIPTSTISIYDSDTSGLWVYSLPNSSFSINIEGKPDLVSALQPRDFRCSISVKDLGEGEHVVPVAVSTPAGVTLKEKVNVDVKIIANPPQETPTPEPSPDLSGT